MLLKLFLCGRCDVREEEIESHRVGACEEKESEEDSESESVGAGEEKESEMGDRESEDPFDSYEKAANIFNKNVFFLIVFVTSESVLLSVLIVLVLVLS